jgi:hypothetical protein
MHKSALGPRPRKEGRLGEAKTYKYLKLVTSKTIDGFIQEIARKKVKTRMYKKLIFYEKE